MCAKSTPPMVKNLSGYYRPIKWEDVKGQNSIVAKLKAQILTQNGLSNGYIFSGRSGIGKTTLARLFFRCLNGEVNKDGNPTDTEDYKVDLIEVNASDKNGVDDMREIIQAVQYSAQGKCKGVLLDEAHMLSKAAWNVLLKPIEEADVKTFWLIATTDLAKIPTTVQTRCQTLKLSPLSWTEIKSRLEEIVDDTKIPISEQDMWIIAKNSNNNLRQAIHLLEQYSSIKDISKIIEDDNGVGFINALITNDLKIIWSTFVSWQEKYDDLDTYLNSLKYDISDLLKVKLGLDNSINEYRLKLYKDLAPKIEAEKIIEMLEIILAIQEKISGVWDYNSLFLKGLCEYAKKFKKSST